MQDIPSDPAKPILGIDCDEVLCAFIAGVAAWHNRVHGTSLSAASFNSTHFASVPGMGDAATTERKVRAFFDSPEWLHLSPVPDAAPALLRLAPRFNLHLVTARSPTQEAVTRAWLARHFPPVFAGMHFTGA